MLLQNFRKVSLLFFAGALLAFTSCSGEEIENVDGEEATETEEYTPRSAPVLNTEDQDIDGDSESSSVDEAIQIAPVELNTQGNTGAKLNPPHGQPGHICEIPVGDPLPTSSVSGGNAPVINTSPTINPTNTGAVKLNPPHGQPGHVCEIPVGDPLN